MTLPVSNRPQLKGYVGAHAGMIKNPVGEKYSNIGLNAGAKLDYKNTYLKTELQAGTAVGAEVKLGHEFDLGKNIGLDTYGTASINIGKDQTDYREVEHKGIYHSAFNPDAEPYVRGKKYGIHAKWTSGEKRMGVGAQLTFKAKNVKFGAGIEAGTRSTLQEDDIKVQIKTNVEFLETDPNTGTQVRDIQHFETPVTIETHKKTGYVTGTAFVDAKVSKHLNVFADGALNQGVKAGVRWTF